MNILERLNRGELLVANILNSQSNGYVFKVGDTYRFNFLEYKVIEMGEGDLEGMIWIARDK